MNIIADRIIFLTSSTIFTIFNYNKKHVFLGDNEALIPADVFFAKIMEDTDTYITWPNKLKIGAKSKKGKF